MATDDLNLLVNEISKVTQIITQFQKSGSVDGANESSRKPKPVPSEVKDATNIILNNTMKLRQLVSGPVEFHQQMIINYQLLACLQWLLHFDIPHHVPLAGGITYSDLADTAQVPVIHLQRAVRLAIANGLFGEKDGHQVFHNDLSASFCTNTDFASTVKWMGMSNNLIAQRFAEMSEKWKGSESTIHTAHNLALNTDLPFYAYQSQKPEVMVKMAAAMRFVGVSGGQHIRHLVHGYDWAALGQVTVVDVGGSMGHASIALAEAYPDLSFIVQDLPGPIENARIAAVKLPSSVAFRITFEAHNFMLPQTRPISSQPTIYLLRQIFANWPNATARQILTSVLPSLETAPRMNKLLIMSKVLNPPSDPSRQHIGLMEEALNRSHDAFMLQAMNGIERSMDEWMSLFASVDQRLLLKQVITPPGSQLSILEVVLAE